VWGNAVDTPAWAYLGKLDTVISTIEAKAQVCKEAASSASRLALRGRPPAPARGGPISPADDDRRLAFLRDFSIGISSRFVSEQTKNIPRMMSNPATDCTGAARPNNPDEIDQARAALCECLKKDESIYLKERFPIAAVPSVKVVHEKTVFAPRSILYISVTLAGKLTKAELKDRTGALVVALTGGVDPDHGPIWYGSTLYRDGSGNPPGPDRLPFTLEMTDFLGRAYTKPVVVTD